MPSHAVQRVIALKSPSPQKPRHMLATVELVCGCTIEKLIAEDRIVDRPGGTSFVVGKFPCPSGHAVRRR